MTFNNAYLIRFENIENLKKFQNNCVTHRNFFLNRIVSLLAQPNTTQKLHIKINTFHFITKVRCVKLNVDVKKIISSEEK